MPRHETTALVQGLYPKYADERRPPAASPQAIPLSVCLADVKHEHVEWLWRGRIPHGKLTLVEGHPGQGKSTLTVDLLARLSKGLPLPGQAAKSPIHVGFFQGEDAPGDTIRPRFEAAGGDVTRCHVLTGRRSADGQEAFISLPHDVDVVSEWVRERGLRVIVIDPLNAFLGGSVDTYKDHDIRLAMRPLGTLAEDLGVSVLVVRHLTKAMRTNAILAGAGSIGIIGVARSALLVAPPCDPDTAAPGRRILAHSKCNVGPLQPSLEFTLTDSPEHGAARIEWGGEVGESANDLVAAEAERTGFSSESAADWLSSVLAGESLAGHEVKRLAEQNGLPWRGVERASIKIGVVKARTGSGRNHRTVWSLPYFRTPIPGTPTTPTTQSTYAGAAGVAGVDFDPLLAGLPQ